MYGLMIVLGLLLGITVAVVRSKRYGFKPEDVLFASFFGGIGLFIGAKLLYILTVIPELVSHRRLFTEEPSLLAPFLAGGFVFYGGLAGAAAGFYIYCRMFCLSFLPMLALVTPSIPLIHGFGRLGCLFAGCCYGIPYEGPGYVIFHNSVSAPDNVPLFPTQLLESSLNFLAFLILIRYAKPSQKPGRIIGLYLIYYAGMRFLMEFLRGDNLRGSLLGMSTSQWISLALIPVGILLMSGIRPLKKQADL
jgi:phosphatidylglycerol:prolipoprotein diacylglycerol transferase